MGSFDNYLRSNNNDDMEQECPINFQPRLNWRVVGECKSRICIENIKYVLKKFIKHLLAQLVRGSR